MRLIHIVCSFFILTQGLTTLHAGKDFLGANWTSYSGFQVDTKAVLPEKEIHPSMWFNEKELTDFKTQLDADKTIREYWALVKNHKFLTSPFPIVIPEDEIWIPEFASANNKRIHKYYGDMTQIPLYCGFMAWMTDDPEEKKRYIERAKAALTRAFDGPFFDLDPTGSGVDKSVDEIYQAIWSQSICAAYDFVQPFLSQQEDSVIRGRLLKVARYTHENLKSWASGPHNHLSKPAWGLAAYALTLTDEPDAADWFRNAMEAANQNTHYHFSSDGIYREGGMYYIFSWLNYVPFLYHYKNVSGIDYFEDFKKSFEWGVIGRNAKGWTMNVEDAFIRPVPTQMVAKAFANYRSFLAPDIPFSEILQWNFQTTDYQPFRDVEKISGFNYTGATWDYPKELYELITYDPSIKASAPTADPTIYMEGGQTLFRSAWLNEPGNEQSYLLFHSVPQADNHDHNDTLSFILYAKNQMMASDSGYTRSSYGEDIRYTYYRRPQAHNTITFDDIPLGDFVENIPNPSEDQLNTSFFDLEKKTAPFRRYLGEVQGSANRTIAFIQGEYFLILDEAKGHDNGKKLDGKFDVYFHGGRSSVDREDNQFTWSYEKDRYGDAAKLISYQLSPGSEISLTDTESTYIKADYASFPSLRTSKAGSSALFGQILFPLGNSDQSPTIEDFSTEKLLGAKITSKYGTDIFLKSHSDKSSSKAGIELDGDFAWIRLQNDEPVQVAGQSTKNLSFKNSPILSSDERVTFALKMGAKVELGIDVDTTTQVRMTLGKDIYSATHDGNPIPFTNKAGVVEIEISKDGNYLLN
ncbi:heparinase II/III-family protein [bacterium]|nr:heparinase II/III-family protein [bacterium]